MTHKCRRLAVFLLVMAITEGCLQQEHTSENPIEIWGEPIDQNTVEGEPIKDQDTVEGEPIKDQDTVEGEPIKGQGETLCPNPSTKEIFSSSEEIKGEGKIEEGVDDGSSENEDDVDGDNGGEDTEEDNKDNKKDKKNKKDKEKKDKKKEDDDEDNDGD